MVNVIMRWRPIVYLAYFRLVAASEVLITRYGLGVGESLRCIAVTVCCCRRVVVVVVSRRGWWARRVFVCASTVVGVWRSAEIVYFHGRFRRAFGRRAQTRLAAVFVAVVHNYPIWRFVTRFFNIKVLSIKCRYHNI